MYLKCENDYAMGVKLYQAIVEKQIKDTTIKQLNVLEKETEKLVNLEPAKEINSSRSSAINTATPISPLSSSLTPEYTEITPVEKPDIIPEPLPKKFI